MRRRGRSEKHGKDVLGFKPASSNGGDMTKKEYKERKDLCTKIELEKLEKSQAFHQHQIRKAQEIEQKESRNAAIAWFTLAVVSLLYHHIIIYTIFMVSIILYVAEGLL